MDGFYYQPEIEKMPRKELEALQLERLKWTVKQALQSPFYSKLYGELGITPDTIQTLADLRKLPFTVKQDMRDNYQIGRASCRERV